MSIFMLSPVENVVFAFWLAFIIHGQIVYRKIARRPHMLHVDIFMATVVVLSLALGYLTHPEHYQMAAMVYSLALQVHCIGVRIRITRDPYLGTYLQLAGIVTVTIIGVAGFY